MDIPTRADNMSLRDWFAGQALTAIPHIGCGADLNFDEVAHDAYSLADAMLRQRSIVPLFPDPVRVEPIYDCDDGELAELVVPRKLLTETYAVMSAPRLQRALDHQAPVSTETKARITEIGRIFGEILEGK